MSDLLAEILIIFFEIFGKLRYKGWINTVQMIILECSVFIGGCKSVPVVILEIKIIIDSLYIFTELRVDFANGGFNAHAVGMETECVLYASEYMLEPLSDHAA